MVEQTYEQYKSDIKDQQLNMPKEQIIEEMDRKNEFIIDLDNLPKQQHNWIKRGIKISCEGANHPHHSHFLVRKAR